MNRTLYLHIGCEKTGTTTLQSVLFSNSALLKQHGFHFAQTGGSRNNRSIPDACIDIGAPSVHLRDLGVNSIAQRRVFIDLLREQFAQEIASLPDTIHSVVVSSEHFQSITKTQEDVESVRRFFNPYFSRVVVVCYLREQAESMQSRYSSTIRNGWANKDTFATMLSECSLDNDLYNYEKLVDTWGCVFGEHNLKIRLFDRQKFAGDNLVDDFLSALEITPVRPVNRNVESTNPPLSQLGQVIGIALGVTVRRYGSDGARNPMWTKAFELLRAGFSGAGRQLSVKDYTLIYERFAQSNSDLNRRLFNREGNLFDFRVPTETQPVHIEEAMAEPLAAIMAEVRRDGAGMTQGDADFLANLSLQYEATDLGKAEHLMRLAVAIKPEEPLLKLQLLEYRNRLLDQK